MHRDGDAFFESLGEIVALEQPRDGVLRAQRDQFLKRERLQPLAIEADLGFHRIENFENLRFVGFRVAVDFVACHRRAGDIAARRIADQPGHVADQKDDGMAQVLKVLHLAQQDGVAKVQVGRGGIKAGFHPQRTVVLQGGGQALAQIFFANQFGEALFQVRQLLLNRRKWQSPPIVEA